MKSIRKQSGFTLVEILIALLLATFVTMAAFRFYIAEHNNMIVQTNISDMQQNLRASLDDVTRNARNAGANLPAGMQSIVASNSNPDSLRLRFAAMGGALNIGDHTAKTSATPVHVAIGTDLSKFAVGDMAYFWHSAQKTGEWFTISSIVPNNGAGWCDIFHLGQNLLFDPGPGDQMIKLQEVAYYVDTTSLAHPALMKSENGAAGQVFADNIRDMQFDFVL